MGIKVGDVCAKGHRDRIAIFGCEADFSVFYHSC
jgi:hypothetical protein